MRVIISLLVLFLIGLVQSQSVTDAVSMMSSGADVSSYVAPIRTESVLAGDFTATATIVFTVADQTKRAAADVTPAIVESSFKAAFVSYYSVNESNVSVNVSQSGSEFTAIVAVSGVSEALANSIKADTESFTTTASTNPVLALVESNMASGNLAFTVTAASTTVNDNNIVDPPEPTPRDNTAFIVILIIIIVVFICIIVVIIVVAMPRSEGCCSASYGGAAPIKNESREKLEERESESSTYSDSSYSSSVESNESFTSSSDDVNTSTEYESEKAPEGTSTEPETSTSGEYSSEYSSESSSEESSSYSSSASSSYS